MLLEHFVKDVLKKRAYNKANKFDYNLSDRVDLGDGDYVLVSLKMRLNKRTGNVALTHSLSYRSITSICPTKNHGVVDLDDIPPDALVRFERNEFICNKNRQLKRKMLKNDTGG